METAAWLSCDLCDIVSHLRAGDLSSEALTEACLARTRRLQPVLNAFIEIDTDGALQAAQAADRARQSNAAQGPLHGVPLAHKDLLYRQGRVSSGGSKILAARPAAMTATALARLDSAGALEIGRLHMAEFAAGGTGHNEFYGDCINPWGTSRITGGSSSGSGAAVAAGMIFGSLGSDTGGSVRLPAALCGVSGLKPSDGRISKHGVLARSWSCDTLGPLARSVRDLALMLEVVAGPDPMDPNTMHGEVVAFSDRLGAPPSGLRVGMVRNEYFTAQDDAINTALEHTILVLAEQGVQTIDIELPDAARLFTLAEVIVKSEAASLHEQWLRERPMDYSVAIRTVIEAGLFISATEYLQAIRMRGELLRRFCQAVFSKVDILLLPTTPTTAPSVAESSPDTSVRAAEAMALFPRFTRPFSYLGLPALSVPAGFDDAGLPASIQLVGAPQQDAQVLAMGQAFQSHTDWHKRVPNAVDDSN